jgi:hypothetical protein
VPWRLRERARAREHGSTRAQRDRGDLEDEFIEQARIVELPRQVIPRSPPPTIPTLRPPAAFTMAGCTTRTSPATKRISALGIAGSVRWLNTQVGCAYGQGSPVSKACSSIHAQV